MLPVKDFYLIRHGETEDNRANIAAGGDYESILTQKGRRQASLIASVLQKIAPKPVRIYASPMKRTAETAEILNQNLKLETTLIEDLREIRMGDWNGLTWDEVIPKLEKGIFSESGEGEQEFVDRVRKGLSTLLENHDDQPPLIVAHGGTFHALGYLYSYGISLVQNCHLHYFEAINTYAEFPWQVWQYDVIDGKIIKSSAPFCPSLQRTAIAL